MDSTDHQTRVFFDECKRLTNLVSIGVHDMRFAAKGLPTSKIQTDVSRIEPEIAGGRNFVRGIDASVDEVGMGVVLELE